MYRLVLDSMSEGVSVATEDGIIIYTNPAEDQMFGYAPGELLGKPVTVLNAYPPEENLRRVSEVIADLRSRGEWIGEWLNARKDGAEFHSSSRITAVELNGAPHWVCVQLDITRQKLAEQERQETERQLLLLIEASGTLLASPGSAEVLRTILDLAQRFVYASAYAVWRRDPSSDVWSPSLGAGLSQEFLRSSVTSFREDSGPGNILAIEDVAAEPLLEKRREALAREGLRSMLIIPLRIRQEASASVVFYWKTSHTFTAPEVRIAAALGNLASSALSTASLYDAQQILREKAESSERRASFLAEAGALLSSSLDYHTTLASVAKLAVPTFADWATVEMLDDEGQVERVAVHHADPEKLRFAAEYRKLYPPQETDVSRVALRTGQSFLIPEVPDAMLIKTARNPEHLLLLRDLGISSVIIVPIPGKEHPIGVITFVSAESGRHYTQADLQTAEVLARSAGAAIENARLYRDVRESELRFRQLAENIRKVFYVTDATTSKMLYVSPAYERIWGASIESLYRDPRSFVDAIHPEDRHIIDRSFQDHSAGLNTQAEYRVVQPNGSIRWVWDRSFLVRDDAGVVYRIAGIAEDITERKQADDALRATNQTLASFLEASPLAVIAFDDARSIRLWNKAAEALYGWSAAEVLGRSLPFDPAPAAEVLHHRKDGSSFSAQLWTSSIPTPAGQEHHLLLVADITERTHAQAALRESEERFRAMADSAPVFMWLMDANRQCIWFNRPWLEFTGRPLSEDLGEGWTSSVHPDDRESATRTCHGSFARRVPFVMEFRLRRHDGQWRWLLDHAIPRYGSDNSFMGYIGSCIDITERREAEEALRKSEERQRLAAEAGQIGLWDWDILTNTLVWSDRVYEFHGLTPAQFPGTAEGFAALIHPGDRDRVSAALSKALETGEPYVLEFRTIRPDGDVRWLSTSAGVVQDSSGRPVRMLGAAVDTTERRRTEDALRKANASLEEFAYASSHDLQEPLRMVTLYTQILLRNSLVQSAEAEKYAGIIQASVKRMQQLINDLLSYSRVLHFEEHQTATTELSLSLDQARHSLAAALEEAGARLEIGPLPSVRGETSHLALVFQNLLANSLKYRHNGHPPEITITAARQDGLWQITVRDNGIGFDQRYAERIFGLFKRLHRDEYPGTGLGLAICQRIIERHGGRIWAESTPGAGAAFHFTLHAAD